MTTEEAEAALEAWATVQRDELVQTAYHAGVTKYRINQITGITRPTIDNILKRDTRTPQEKITNFLAEFTAQWPKQQPWALSRLPGMASAYQAADIAVDLYARQAFLNLKLGTWLNTTQRDVLAAAVDRLPAALFPADAALLVSALEIAARRQHDEARQKLAVGLLGGAALAIALGASRG